MTNLQPARAADLRVLPFTFAATEITVEATSTAGRKFLGDTTGRCAGVNPTAVTLSKSEGLRLLDVAALRGVRVS